MDDVKMAESINVLSEIQVVDSENVKVEPVKNLENFLQQNINFQSLRQAVMINGKVIVGAKMPTFKQASTCRQ